MLQHQMTETQMSNIKIPEVHEEFAYFVCYQLKQISLTLFQYHMLNHT